MYLEAESGAKQLALSADKVPPVRYIPSRPKKTGWDAASIRAKEKQWFFFGIIYKNTNTVP